MKTLTSRPCTGWARRMGASRDYSKTQTENPLSAFVNEKSSALFAARSISA